ncbi:MAG TPA: 1-acyl-sn-glycerol-3-phosphate acyltransferase [Proteobacteria bacterium]|nr:1-acyl-sn-glycerol-3-phosphate acyltransferase [Pseudomonadota bacterium]
MNLWVYPLLALWTLCGLLLVAPLLLLLWKAVTGWSRARIVRHSIWFYGRGWMLLVAPFVRFEVDGFSAPEAGPVLYVVNHLSFFDTYCMAAQPHSNIAFAVRGWPFRRLFWYTACVRLARRYLEVEGAPFDDLLVQAREIVAAGGSLLFFPEGHRSRDGELQRFYSGAFLLALKLGLPVIPLCLVGTDCLLPPGRWLLRPATICLRALPAVDPADFTGPEGHRRLRRQVKETMARELARLRQPSGPSQ